MQGITLPSNKRAIQGMVVAVSGMFLYPSKGEKEEEEEEEKEKEEGKGKGGGFLFSLVKAAIVLQSFSCKNQVLVGDA